MGKTTNDEQTTMTVDTPLGEIPGAPWGQKPKRAKKEQDTPKVNPNDLVDENKMTVDRQIRTVELTTKGHVKIKFVELIVHPLAPGDEDNRKTKREYSVNSPDMPHPDLVNAMKSLRKPALELCEIEVDRKLLSNYTVTKIDIDGDITLHQSRAQFTIGKKVDRTDKVIPIGPSPQYTMYGDSDFAGAADLTKTVEDVIREAWAYINGKHAEDNQLPLFQIR